MAGKGRNTRQPPLLGKVVGEGLVVSFPKQLALSRARNASKRQTVRLDRHITCVSHLELRAH